jgi:hypothetical protein
VITGLIDGYLDRLLAHLRGSAYDVRRFRLAVNLAVAGVGCYFLARLVRTWSIGVGRRNTCPMSTVHLHGPAATGLGYVSGHAAAVALARWPAPI